LASKTSSAFGILKVVGQQSAATFQKKDLPFFFTFNTIMSHDDSDVL